jgi:hypothetical protein
MHLIQSFSQRASKSCISSKAIFKLHMHIILRHNLSSRYQIAQGWNIEYEIVFKSLGI